MPDELPPVRNCQGSGEDGDFGQTQEVSGGKRVSRPSRLASAL